MLGLSPGLVASHTCLSILTFQPSLSSVCLMLGWETDTRDLLEHSTTSRTCPMCQEPKLSESHLFFFCPSVEHFRKDFDLTTFRTVARVTGFTEEETFRIYINGFNWNGCHVPDTDFVARGHALDTIRGHWLTLWWERSDHRFVSYKFSEIQKLYHYFSLINFIVLLVTHLNNWLIYKCILKSLYYSFGFCYCFHLVNLVCLHLVIF